MNKRLALAYRIIEIDKQKYFVVFPPPSKEQTNRIDFDYTEYLNTLIKQLRTTPLKERESLIEKWASLVKIEQSDMLLKKSPNRI